MTDITQLRELIDRATNPLLEQINWQYVIDVCDAVKSFDEGPHIVTSFVIEHLRGSEKVALHALTLLDACVENCGPHFYRVIGKFKFLNELTQLVSKKHGYVNTPEKVRDRILFLMSKWRVNLQLPKILEVCATLERQGYPLTSLSRDATSFDKNFLQWKYKSSLSPKSESEHILPRLLQSKDPADLTTANLLIKEIFETEYTEEKNKEKLKDDLNIVRENIRIFVEVLEASKDTLEHKEVLEEICEALLGVKPRLANLCRELERDEDIEFVLNIYSKLIDALELYDQFVRLGKKPRSNVLIDFGDQGLEEAATIPSELFSVVILDRNGISITIYYEITKTAQAMTLKAQIQLKNDSSWVCEDVIFLIAVPKVMNSHLESPSGQILLAKDPFNGPGIITQRFSVTNPTKKPIRLQYKLLYSANGRRIVEQGVTPQLTCSSLTKLQ